MEALVSIAVIAFVTTSIYFALSGAVRNMGEAKQRTGAIALAGEKMEIFRNLPYEEVGVEGGVVPGPVPAEETVSKNGFTYEVDTEVRYVDDSFDGTGEDDPVSSDYKKAQVEVGWSIGGETKSVQFFSIFVPEGVESDVGGGTLAVNTTNSAGEIVSDVEVVLESMDDSPEIYYTTSTDSQGGLTLQGVPAQSYRLSLSKDGYEDVRTYPNPPESDFSPINADIVISEGDFYTKDFTINKTGSLKISTKDIFDESAVEGMEVELMGGKKIGNSPDTYNLDEANITDSSGEIDYGEVSPGEYTVVNAGEMENSQYQYVGTEEELEFSVASQEEKEIALLFAQKDVPSLVLDVLDNNTGEPVEGASAVLTAENFDQDLTVGSSGRVYFPARTDPVTEMENIEYQLNISVEGYEDFSESISIDALTMYQANLIKK